MKSAHRLCDLPGPAATDHLILVAASDRTLCGLLATGRYDSGLPVTVPIVTARSTPREGDGMVLLCAACAGAYLATEIDTEAGSRAGPAPQAA